MLKMNLNFSKNKKGIIVGGVVALFIILVVVAIVIKVRAPKAEVAIANEDNYEIKGEETLKFNAISIISNEQRVIIDKSQGELEDIKVKDGQEVKVGDVLFSYHNTAVEDKITQYDRQIATNNDKAYSAKKNKDEINTNISELKAELTTMGEQLNKVQSDISKFTPEEEKENEEQYNELTRIKDVLTSKRIEISQKIEILNGQASRIDMEIASYEEGSKSIVTERDILNKKIVKDVIAEIDGVVKVNNKGLDDPTTAYMRVISKAPLVKGEASEFDVKSLEVDDEVMLKVISSGEYVKGTITEIDELPIEEPGRPTTGYNFYIKPENSIMIGFNIEVRCNYKALEIPKDYVYEKDSNLYVIKENLTSTQEIEIKAILEDDKYYFLDGAIGVGDNLIKNPSKVLEGSK